jgi:hypothetical protein
MANVWLFILKDTVANEKIKLNQTACLFVHVASDYFLFNSVLLIIPAKHRNNDQQLIFTADFHYPHLFTLGQLNSNIYHK